MTLRSLAEVDQWVAVNGIEALRKAADERRFAGPGQVMALKWLQRHDAHVVRLDDIDLRAAERLRDERMAAAAERSADAAERSANAAQSANRIAWLALFVALGALLVAAWPFIKAAS